MPPESLAKYVSLFARQHLFRCMLFVQVVNVLGHNCWTLVFPFCSVHLCIVEVLVTGLSEYTAIFKLLGQGYNVEIKEKYAFESVVLKNKDLLYLWQSNLQDLAKYTGNHWWNQGSPELGTIGILSKFYCLTKNQTKTVDELYPNGFKP